MQGVGKQTTNRCHVGWQAFCIVVQLGSLYEGDEFEPYRPPPG